MANVTENRTNLVIGDSCATAYNLFLNEGLPLFFEVFYTP
jgi:hypothetical protein